MFNNAPQPPSAPMSGPGQSYSAEPQEIHILDRLSVLFKYRKVVITVFLLVVGAMMLQTYTTPKMYKAQVRLLIEDERQAMAGFQDVETGYSDPELYHQTQYRILKGRDLAHVVVKQLDLGNVPEFNGTGPQPASLLSAIAAVKGRLFGVFQRNERIEPPTPNETPDQGLYIDAFLSRVTVDPIRNSRLVDVYFESADPKFAARAANALADHYVAQNLAVRQRATAQQLKWLTDELGKQQSKSEISEGALANYRAEKNALSLSERQNIVGSQLSQLSEAATRAKTMRVEKETQYNLLKSLDVAAESFPASGANPAIQMHRNQLATIKTERRQLLERYGEKHPRVVDLNTEIEDVTRQLQDEVAKLRETVYNDYRSALNQERQLDGALEAQKHVAMDLDQKGAAYSVLEREAESDQKLFEALLQKHKELSVVNNSGANNVRVVDRAEEPKAPYSPDPGRNLFIALVLGLALGVATAVGIDYLDDTIKTPEDITRKLKLPFLGLVPAVRGERLPVLSGPVPHDFGEAFRAIRTSLVFSSGEDRRIIAVTSAQPLEGKTTTACNLAMALAFGGSRVLLIDADMRRPGLHKIMGLRNDVGLSHLLVGRARARDAIQRTHDPNLWVMSAGRTPPNPSELIASERMQRLVDNLSRGPFDWVIIDTPPVLAVTDAVILAPLVAGVVFVLGAEMTRRRLAERAVETLLASTPRVIGCVLNRVDYDRNKYYYSRFYGYQYKSYYGRASSAA